MFTLSPPVPLILVILTHTQGQLASEIYFFKENCSAKIIISILILETTLNHESGWKKGTSYKQYSIIE